MEKTLHSAFQLLLLRKEQILNFESGKCALAV